MKNFGMNELEEERKKNYLSNCSVIGHNKFSKNLFLY
jgi:hypothetical protein